MGPDGAVQRMSHKLPEDSRLLYTLGQLPENLGKNQNQGKSDKKLFRWIVSYYFRAHLRA